MRDEAVVWVVLVVVHISCSDGGQTVSFSVKVSAGYCSDSDVMVTAVAASALLEGGACAAPGRARVPCG